MTDDPRLDPHFDARLSELISDAADSAEPGEGLTAIRSRTHPDHKETPMSRNSSRNWLYAVSGAMVGTAAVIIAIAVVSQLNDDNGSTPTASGTQTQQSTPTPTDSASDTPTSSDPSESTGAPVEAAVPVYYAGDGPRGTVLFREFQPGIGMDPVAQSAQAAVAGPARDPDYRTLWPSGTQATASYDGDVITVDLSGPDGGGGLHDVRPGCPRRTRTWPSSSWCTPCRVPPRRAPVCSCCSTDSTPTRSSASPRPNRSPTTRPPRCSR